MERSSCTDTDGWNAKIWKITTGDTEGTFRHSTALCSVEWNHGFVGLRQEDWIMV